MQQVLELVGDFMSEVPAAAVADMVSASQSLARLGASSKTNNNMTLRRRGLYVFVAAQRRSADEAAELQRRLSQYQQRLFMQRVRMGVLERIMADVDALPSGPLEERLQELVLSNWRDRELLGRLLDRHPELRLETPQLEIEIYRDMVASGLIQDDVEDGE